MHDEGRVVQLEQAKRSPRFHPFSGGSVTTAAAVASLRE